jgi:hypothetical protein
LNMWFVPVVEMKTKVLDSRSSYSSSLLLSETSLRQTPPFLVIFSQI